MEAHKSSGWHALLASARDQSSRAGKRQPVLAVMASADAAARDAWVADHVSGEERRRFVCQQADAIGDFLRLEELDAFTQSWSPLARARFLRGWRTAEGRSRPVRKPPRPPRRPRQPPRLRPRRPFHLRRQRRPGKGRSSRSRRGRRPRCRRLPRKRS